MAVDQQYTPLPVQSLAPIHVEIADWLDVSANSTSTVLENNRFGDQVMDVTRLGGRPETNVDVEVEAVFTDERGGQTETMSLESTAFGNFNNPIETGPVATDRLVWRIVNRSGTDFTDGGGDPYQTFMGYDIRPLTVIEKLRRRMPLNDTERRLAERVFPGEDFSVADLDALNIAEPEDPAFKPNLEGKNVIETDSEASTVDISATGTADAVDIVDERTDTDPATGLRSDILYLTSIGINGQEYTEDDDLRIRILRDTTDDFARIKTFGQPGIGTGQGVGASVDGVSFPPYEARWFLPFLERMTVQVFTNGSAINNVDVRVGWARVERTVVEKALYGLENEIRSDDELASARADLYQQIRDKVRVGLPLDIEREQAQEMAAAGSR